MHYERTCTIERAEDGAEAGLISGTLATDGILNMSGVKLPERAPLLFGHDDYTGTGNLGSWTGFHKFGDGKKLGDSGIRGTAQIELSGEGSQADWRGDIAHMIERGHIGQFSVRWEEIGEPVARVNLPSDHPAFVDSKKATGRQRWGLYFDKWRLLEGSVVTLGADPAALVGRMQEAEGDVRVYWRKAINHALEERHEPASGLVALSTGAGFLYIEREAYDAMLEEANARMQAALDALEAALEAREDANEALALVVDGADAPTAPDTPTQIRSEVEPDNGDEPAEAAPQKQNLDLSSLNTPTDSAEIMRAFSEALDASEDRIRKAVQGLIDLRTGKVN
jgi:hypothetical protein